MKQFVVYFSSGNFDGTFWYTNEHEETFNVENETQVYEAFKEKYQNTDTQIYSINNVKELIEYVVCYTDTIDEDNYLYPDMSDETIFAFNKEDAKKQFMLKHKHEAPRRVYTIDHIYTIEELENLPEED